MKFLKRFDIEDTLLTAGGCLLIAGVTAISRPGGLILSGLLCIVLAVLLSSRTPPTPSSTDRAWERDKKKGKN